MSEYDETDGGEATGFDWESALITDIIDNKSIRTVIKHKIDANFFFDTQGKSAYLFLIEWYNNKNYGDTPSWESFQHAYPDFAITRVEESTIALCDKVRETKLYSDLASVLHEVAESAGGDPKAAFEMLRGKVSSLHTAHTVDESCDIRSRIPELREEYMAMKSGATGLKGAPWPWQALNDSTLGIQDTQLIFMYGRPKSGKTWLALKTMSHLRQQGHKVLILSQEMSDIEICRRFVALETGVDYNLYLRGQLPPDVEGEFLDNLDAFIEQEGVIVDMLTSTGDAAITELSAKIDEYGCTFVLIDAFYTLGADWKELGAVMRGCKRLAKVKRVPIIGTTQANRSGKGKKADDAADDFAFADAFYQWCDVALRITSEIENKRNKEAIISTAALREGIPVTFTVNMRVASDLNQKSVIKVGGDDEDIDGQIDQDTLDGESDNPEEETVAVEVVTPAPRRKLVLKKMTTNGVNGHAGE